LAEGGIAGLGGEGWGEGSNGRDAQHERPSAIPEIAVDGHEGYPRG
jgi:hypothetical protein